MCLTSIIRKYKPDQERFGQAYTVLERGTFIFHPDKNPAYDPNTTQLVPRNFPLPQRKWLSAIETAVHTIISQSYTSGFHLIRLWWLARAFKNHMKKQYPASDFKVFKVEYRGNHTVGIDRGMEVIVCREMFILGEDDECE